MKSVLIAGYAGIGKSYLPKKYSNCIDMELSLFKYFNSEAEHNLSEEEREKPKELNPDYPQNYVDAIVENLRKPGKVILIGLREEVTDLLDKLGTPYYVALPTFESRDVLIKRMKERRNSEEYIQKRMKKFPSKFDKYKNHKIIYLHGDNYLEDELLKMNILKIKS